MPLCRRPLQTLGVFSNIFLEVLRVSCPKHPELLGGEGGGKQGVSAGSWELKDPGKTLELEGFSCPCLLQWS